MKHPFETLRTEYTSLLAQMRVLRTEEVDDVARKLLGFVNSGRYDGPCLATGVPRIVAAASFEREASSNFRLSPAQGDPWNQVSHHVPRGVGPFRSWGDAAEWAYRHEGFDKIGAGNWSWERACFESEMFNGFGYRAHGVHSPYLWAGTSIYRNGKFTSDGHFDAGAVDRQLGVVPVMRRMIDINPALALPQSYPDRHIDVVSPPKPEPTPVGLHDAVDLQRALNSLGADPVLKVDGSFGRMTRLAVRHFQMHARIGVDGFAGPQTWKAIEAALASKDAGIS
jgi:lysozyme family protein